MSKADDITDSHLYKRRHIFSFATALISLLLGSIPALSQRTTLAYPPSGLNVTAGSQITVEVQRTSTTSSVTEVGLVIAMMACPAGNCFPPDEWLGTVLYNGPFNPQFINDGDWQAHQNFTVTVPEYFTPGTYQLNDFINSEEMANMTSRESVRNLKASHLIHDESVSRIVTYNTINPGK
ncbi:hypothetical protein CPB84DRAFT_1750814 [Gymnopilus junonius]|uniref:Uncharacterized protein n=1 Tax=Gymnopilus junonius TaxID=109634 RepID=A0A9P5NGX3_GYMJU|nr:hypothetical protein CPB84DRAFT_1750814 [Gymnopilus junonius]